MVGLWSGGGTTGQWMGGGLEGGGGDIKGEVDEVAWWRLWGGEEDV